MYRHVHVKKEKKSVYSQVWVWTGKEREEGREKDVQMTDLDSGGWVGVWGGEVAMLSRFIVHSNNNYNKKETFNVVVACIIIIIM